METSAKSGLNIIELFVQAAKMLYKDYIKYRKNQRKDSYKINNNDNKTNESEKKRCC